jgi:hypothetical protein
MTSTTGTQKNVKGTFLQTVSEGDDEYQLHFHLCNLSLMTICCMTELNTAPVAVIYRLTTVGANGTLLPLWTVHIPTFTSV